MPARILIVDDEAIIAETTALMLRQLGYVVAGTANSSTEALRAVEQASPDLVLMDINLGADHEGIPAADAVRLRHDLPVVYVTAYADDDTLARAKVTHPFGYVSKPFEARDLHVAIEIALHNHQLEKRLQQSERARREGESRLRAILDNIPDIAWLKDRAGRYLAVNHAWCRHFGLREEDALGRTALEILPADQAQRFHHEDLAVIASGREFRGEDRLPHRTGVEAFYEVFKAAVRDPAGEIIGLAGTTRDVTERVLLTTALARRAEHFEALLATTRDGVIEADERGRMLDVNQAYCRLMGYAPHELVGQHMSFVEARESPEEVDAHTQEMIRHGGARFESQHRAKDGHLVDLEISITHLATQGRMVAFLHDITARKQAKSAREAAENVFRAVWEQSNNGMRLTDSAGNIRAVNDAFCRLVGMPRDALVGQPFSCTYHEHSPDEFASMQRRYQDRFAQRAVSERYSRKMTLKDRRVLELDVTSSFVELDQVVLLLALFQDVTAQRHAEAAREELAQLLKFKNQELERLVYLTSHDLRSPMLNIQGFAHRIAGDSATLRQIVESDPFTPADRAAAIEIVRHQLPRSFGFIQTSVEKMDRLITSLLRLSRLGRAAFQPKPLEVNALVTEVMGALAFSIQAADGVVEVGPLPPCTGDAALVSQLFSNLIDNAIKYRAPGRGLRLTISGEVKNGQAIYRVADNGVGIKPENLERIWEVFFRVDPTGAAAGDGLGLNLVRGIVERHGGKAWVESVPGEGSRFFFALPVEGPPPS